MKKSTATKILIRLILAGTGVIAGLLAGELVLRLFFPQPLLGTAKIYAPVDGIETFQYAANLDFRFKTLDGEFTIRTSPSGNRGRDPDAPLPKTPQPEKSRLRPDRLVFCGDSFCFGQGVEEEESLPGQVSRILGNEAEVFNIGQPAYGPRQSAARLANWLDRWGADIAVYLFFIGNDFNDCDPRRLESLHVAPDGTLYETGKVSAKDPRAKAPRFRTWLWRHSMLFSLFRRSLAGRMTLFYEDRALFNGDLLTGDTLLVNAVERALMEMKDECTERNTRFVVGIVPSPVQMDEHGWEEYAGNRPEMDRWAPQKWLIEFCGQSGIACLDLASPVWDLQGGVYLPTDRHLTPAASRKMAQALVESGLLSAGTP